MSHSFYRGKLVTSKEIKGPFTEASDTLKKSFDILLAAIGENTSAHCLTVVHEGHPRNIFITIGGLVIAMREDGLFEIVEGAA